MAARRNPIAHAAGLLGAEQLIDAGAQTLAVGERSSVAAAIAANRDALNAAGWQVSSETKEQITVTDERGNQLRLNVLYTPREAAEHVARVALNTLASTPPGDPEHGTLVEATLAALMNAPLDGTVADPLAADPTPAEQYLATLLLDEVAVHAPLPDRHSLRTYLALLAVVAVVRDDLVRGAAVEATLH